MPENCKPINEPTGLFDLNHPLKICSPLGLPNSYKPGKILFYLLHKRCFYI